MEELIITIGIVESFNLLIMFYTIKTLNKHNRYIGNQIKIRKRRLYERKRLRRN